MAKQDEATRQIADIAIKRQALQEWLDLPQTRKIRTQWAAELGAARRKLETLRPANFGGFITDFAIAVISLQEEIRLRKSLVDDPVTAITFREKRLEQLQQETTEPVSTTYTE